MTAAALEEAVRDDIGVERTTSTGETDRGPVVLGVANRGSGVAAPGPHHVPGTPPCSPFMALRTFADVDVLIQVIVGLPTGEPAIEIRIPLWALQRVQDAWLEHVVQLGMESGAAVAVAVVDAPEDLFGRAVCVDGRWLVDLDRAHGRSGLPATVWVDGETPAPVMRGLRRMPDTGGPLARYEETELPP